MNQLPMQSRISELKREIEAIANVPKADRKKAIEYAMRLIAQHPGQQNQDERIAKMFMLDLAECLLGVDLDVLEKLVDPKRVRSKWLPSVPEVSEFIDGKMEPKRSQIGWNLDEISTIERRESEPPYDDDVRDRNVEMLRNLSATIRETADMTRRAGSKVKPVTVDQRYTKAERDKMLLDSLANLEIREENAQDG